MQVKQKQQMLFSSVGYVPVKGEIIWYLSLTRGGDYRNYYKGYNTWIKSRGRVEVGEGGFDWGGMEGWGEKAYNYN